MRKYYTLCFVVSTGILVVSAGGVVIPGDDLEHPIAITQSRHDSNSEERVLRIFITSKIILENHFVIECEKAHPLSDGLFHVVCALVYRTIVSMPCVATLPVSSV